MPRVIGIDPGTVSIDLCGLDGGTVWLDRSLPTAEALRDPALLASLLREGGSPTLITGPSGYGLPLIRADAATEADLRLAFLAAEGDSGGIGGLRQLARLFAASGLPIWYTPGVVHLSSVPAHRKLNRVDMGTADKVAAAALGIWDQARRFHCEPRDTSFILLELGGAFSAALAIERGAIVDGLGGTSGPMGWQSRGGWDGEAAFLASPVDKAMLFRGGKIDSGAAGLPGYVEGAHKAVLALTATLSRPQEILLSGRHAKDSEVREALEPRLSTIAPVRDLGGFATVSKQGAQGAALIADGLAGGAQRPLVDALRLREATGTVLDYLNEADLERARRRIGLE
jgi:predicted butyrate kinase (DUF1464 family)